MGLISTILFVFFREKCMWSTLNISAALWHDFNLQCISLFGSKEATPLILSMLYEYISILKSHSENKHQMIVYHSFYLNQFE